MDGKQQTKECRLNHLHTIPNVKRKIYDLWGDELFNLSWTEKVVLVFLSLEIE